jgi:tRNA-dihydrouridine synthase
LTLILDAHHQACEHLISIINLKLFFKDIIREGAGPALLKRTKRLSEIFHKLVEWKSVLTTLPNLKAVGCKIRLGLNESEVRSQVFFYLQDN